MAKQTTSEEKIKAIKEYLAGETTQRKAAEKLGVCLRTYGDWVRMYETFGEDVFRKSGIIRYPVELKKAAVRDYLSGGDDGK